MGHTAKLNSELFIINEKTLEDNVIFKQTFKDEIDEYEEHRITPTSTPQTFTVTGSKGLFICSDNSISVVIDGSATPIELTEFMLIGSFNTVSITAIGTTTGKARILTFK